MGPVMEYHLFYYGLEIQVRSWCQGPKILVKVLLAECQPGCYTVVDQSRWKWVEILLMTEELGYH